MEGPGWRWQQALRLRTKPESADSRADPLVLRALQYLLQPAGSINTDGSDIAVALAIERDWVKGRWLQLMVLAGLDSAEIGSLVGAPLAVVELWEKLFFDARELRTALAWIDQFLVSPAIQCRDYEFAEEIKLAVSRGPAWIRNKLRSNN